MNLSHLKAAFTTRHVPLDAIDSMIGGDDVVPRAGDLVVATVTAIGQHQRIERRDGRRAQLFVGDSVLVAYGNRYAPDQFEAVVPARLQPCDLVAAGGIAARTVARHSQMNAPTALTPLGLCVDVHGRRIDVGRFAPAPPESSRRPPLVVATLGTAMNAGKTTTAAHLVRGLRAAGHRTAALKVTGTGAGGDLWLYRDAGADTVLDFTDAGHASTSLLEPARVRAILDDLLGHAAAAGCDAAVLEIADGLLQPETAALLDDAGFAASIEAVVFAAGDAMGASAGVARLREHGLPIVAVSGLVAASPLAAREAELVTGLPVLGLERLEDSRVVEMFGAAVRPAGLCVAVDGEARATGSERLAA